MSMGSEAKSEIAINMELEEYHDTPSGRELREHAEHITKEGKKLRVMDMSDRHLYNTYMCTGKWKYMHEMILRAFEAEWRE